MQRLASMLERILVGTDFSQGACAALDRALSLPRSPDACIDVLHVIPEAAPESDEATATEQLERELERARTTTSGQRARLVAHIARGTTYVEIVRAARARDVELIVLGVHGTRWFSDLFIGSTASRVVRTADVPVLLVRRAAAGPYRKALVSVALTDADRRMFQLARQIGVDRPSVVHAVHVPFEGLRAPTAAARDASRMQYCSEASGKLQPHLASCGEEVADATVCAGDARAVVLDETRRLGADILICGTHARSGIAHALLGSVAETLISMAPCDVLIARPARFTFEPP